jgi:hypothetical protein
VEAIRKGPEHHICEKYRRRKHECQVQSAKPRKRSHGGGAPNCGRSVEPTHITTFFEDDSRTEEAHSRDHVGDDASWGSRVVIEQQTAHDEGSGSASHKGVRARSRHALPPLSFQADECAHTDGHHKPKSELNSADSGHAVLLLPI